MEIKQPEIRLALLSTDHEDMEGYEKALRTLFEENVISVGHFNWGVGHPNPPVALRDYDGHEFNGRDKDAFSLHLRVPGNMASSVSVFQEQLTNTTLRRDRFDQDKKKSFTLAVYEVVHDDSVTEFHLGRIKIISNCFFPEIGIGHGMRQEQQPQIGLAPRNDQPEQWKISPTPRKRPAAIEESSVHFTLAGRELIANTKARQALHDMTHAEISKAGNARVKSGAKK